MMSVLSMYSGIANVLEAQAASDVRFRILAIARTVGFDARGAAAGGGPRGVSLGWKELRALMPNEPPGRVRELGFDVSARLLISLLDVDDLLGLLGDVELRVHVCAFKVFVEDPADHWVFRKDGAEADALDRLVEAGEAPEISLYDYVMPSRRGGGINL
jgi:hypothetical protein